MLKFKISIKEDGLLKKYYNIVNYGTIILIAILLILVLFKLVPNDWFISFLIISLGLLIVRIIFRVFFIYQNRKMKREGTTSNLPNEQTDD